MFQKFAFSNFESRLLLYVTYFAKYIFFISVFQNCRHGGVSKWPMWPCLNQTLDDKNNAGKVSVFIQPTPFLSYFTVWTSVVAASRSFE